MLAVRLVQKSSSHRHALPVEAALEALDGGRYDEARQLAEALRAEGAMESDSQGNLAFVFGALTMREAERADMPEKDRLLQSAAGYLETAHVRGFPRGREAEGSLLLAKCLYASNRFADARSVLRESLGLNQSKTAEIHFLFAGSYLNDAPPDLPKAWEENRLALADDTLPADQHPPALLQGADILLRMGKLSDCLAQLNAAPAGSASRSEAMLLRGQALLGEARLLKNKANDAAAKRRITEQYQAAVTLFRQAQDNQTPDSVTAGKAMYLVGVCLMEQGDLQGAADQFERTRLLHPSTPEALAAVLQEALVLRRTHQEDESLAAFRRVLRSVANPERYRNPWFSLEELRNRILDACQQDLEARRYDRCLQLAQQFCPLFSTEQKTQTTAEIEQAWGRDLVKQTEHLPASRAEPVLRQAREHLRQAGARYARLAKMRIATREYPEDLWRSAANFVEGCDYRRAAPAFQQYLSNEVRQRQPEALLGLGESLLAIDRIDDGLRMLRKCIASYPQDAPACRARILAAGALLEQGNAAEAEKLLEENLGGQSLTPASKEWRDSLFALGRLLRVAGRYDEAIRRLDEAAHRYGDSPEGMETRFLLADCYHRQAGAEIGKLKQDVAERTKAERMQRVRGFQTAALNQYRQVQSQLMKRQETEELGPIEKAALRNSYFAVGGLLTDLGQYEAALKVFIAAANRYQNVPEALQAYLETARTYRRLHKADEARGTVAQAKLVLARLPPAAPFEVTTNYNRRQWTEVLEEMGKE
ncbi:MAG: tetratricopeptide repeat protein [Thermoguttaceae bacterium]